VSRQTATNSLTKRTAYDSLVMGIFLLKFQQHFSPIPLVITGFNTDIIYKGVTYHVQTEDKGLDTPLILSLVYDRGTILASKRSPYEDLLQLGFDEKVLLDRLQKQHKVICAAIKAGRIEDLKRMTLETAAKLKKSADEPNNPKVQEVSSEKRLQTTAFSETKPIGQPKTPIDSEPKNEQRPRLKIEIEAVSETEEQSKLAHHPKLAQRSELELPDIKLPEPEKIKQVETIWDSPIEISEDEIVVDDVQIVDDEIFLADEAVAIVPDFAKHEPLPQDVLSIELVNDNGFKGGERKTLSILVASGNAAIGNASVMVKVLGSAFRPLIFHAKTDSNGVAVIHLHLPHFRSGRAAVLIKAMSGGEEAELRRVVSQG
jgi:hypothetical protein